MSEEKNNKENEYPLNGLMPKDEIEASLFLKRFPKYDGRGVIVAIFDTGVDPGAPGLQITSDGKAKIVDIVDGSGSGDVDTSTIRKVDDNGCILGLSGRKLVVDPQWNNPSGQYYVGIKNAYELFPPPLVKRMKDERLKEWQSRHRQLLAELQTDIQQWEQAHPKPTVTQLKEKNELKVRLEMIAAMQNSFEDPGPIFDCVVFHDGHSWKAVVAYPENVLSVDDQQQQQQQQAVELSQCTLLSDFRSNVEPRYATFSSIDMMNYGIHVYNEGQLLSIVVSAGSHGTHVAGIVGAYYENQPELNGIAPGCQIVSVKIGDSRLGSMETGPALIRGLISCLESKCDIINMSYGEATSIPDRGRFCELASELVHKHGVIFISSAGNNGPALSTTGAPGATTDAIIGVGAYVSPAMMAADYSLRDTQLRAESQYTWSSRGPTADGSLGVCISACGGAIAPVPNWSLQKHTMMNGTSMSSPSACGGVTLLLSALKQRHLHYTPFLIRRALENTARLVRNIERLAQGHGLLQVNRAYEYLNIATSNSSSSTTTTSSQHYHADLLKHLQLYYRISATIKGQIHGRGIYLREPYQIHNPSDVVVEVTPQFHEKEDNEAKVNFECRVGLQATQSWITTSQFMMLMNEKRTFDVRVDPTNLPPGVHFGEVLAYDIGFETTAANATDASRRNPFDDQDNEDNTFNASSHIGSGSSNNITNSNIVTNRKGFAGCLFRVPVTVVIPEPAQARHQYWLFDQPFTTGKIMRKFYHVPAGATWADITLKGKDIDTHRRFVVHAAYLVPHKPFQEKEEYINLRNYEEAVVSLAVVPNVTLEVCIAQFWSSFGDCKLDLEVRFKGLQPNPSVVMLDGAVGVTRVDVHAHPSFANQMLNPSARFTSIERCYRPVSSVIQPLPHSTRDTLPDGRHIYQLVLTYEVEVKNRTKITPRLPTLNGVLYEAEYEAQMVLIFDNNKQYIGCSDVFAKTLDVKKGKYTILVNIRHDVLERLESLKHITLVTESPLPNKRVTVPLFSSFVGVAAGKDSFRTKSIQPGETVAVFFGNPAWKEIAATGAAVGDVLIGRVNYTKRSDKKESGVGRKPGGFRMYYVVPPAPRAEKKEEGVDDASVAAANTTTTPVSSSVTEEKNTSVTPSSKNDKSPVNGEELIRDAQLKLLSTLKNAERDAVYQILFPQLLKNYSTHLPVLSLRLNYLDEHKDRQSKLNQIIEAADAVINQINLESLAAHYGVQLDKDDSVAVKLRKEKDEIKKTFLDALYKKARVLLDKCGKKPSKQQQQQQQQQQQLQIAESRDITEFKETFLTLQKWADFSKEQQKYIELQISYESMHDRYACALKILTEFINAADAGLDKKWYELRIELLHYLGWRQWAAYESFWLFKRFPNSYTVL